MPYFGASPSSTLASADLNGQALILDADADTTITADTDDQIDIRIAGADDFRFTANTLTALSGSTIDGGAEIKANKISPSSSTAFTLGDSGDTFTIPSGATIANSGTATGFGVALANDGDNRVVTGTGSGGLNGEANLVFDGNKFYVADSANAGLTTGLTINQGAADNEIFALKSSDVAHGMTSLAETDTYFYIQKYSGADAGATIRSFSEATNCLQIHATSVGENTGDTTGSSGSMVFTSTIKSGTSNTAHGATGNMMSWHNSGTTAMILKGNGVLHLTSTSLVALDEEDDAMLIRQLDLVGNKESFENKEHSTPAGIIETQWDKFVEKNDSKLKEIGVLSSENDFIALQPWVKLANGAIWQQRAMFETMKQVAEEMLPGFADKLNERLEAQSLPALPA
jgi:hypothetical protein